MKRKLLSLFLIALLPVLVFAGCKKEPENKINMTRYFTACSYVVKGSGSSVTGNINTYLSATPSSYKQYESITIKGDSNWLYGMTLEYFSFDVYSKAAGEFQIQMEFTNLTKGSNEQDTTPDKVLIETFQGNIEANTPRTITIKFKDGDKVKSISTETKLTISFGATPDTTYTIGNLQFYGSHK